MFSFTFTQLIKVTLILNNQTMSLQIAWASQSGNSVDLLRQFIDHCQKESLSIESIQQLNQNIHFHRGVWVFFVSTTGQGNPPHKMRTFWKQFMKKSYKLETEMRFAIYSLGDSSYGDDFGMTARKLRQRLKMLGAEEFVQIGLGDDSDGQGYREVYLKRWRDQVSIFIKNNSTSKYQKLTIQRISMRDQLSEIGLRIEDIKDLSLHKNRKTFWVKLLVDEKNNAKQGDIVQIYPHNKEQDVQFMLNHFQKTGQQIINFKNQQISIRQLLSQHLNVSYMVNYYFFVNNQAERLLNSTQDIVFQEKIKQFSYNYEQYFNFIKKYKRNIIQFIKDFEIKIDFQYFIRNINEIVGRKYSIAKVEGKYIYLLIKLVQDQMTEGRLYHGLCSHDLYKHKGQIRKGQILQGQITPNQLRPNNIIITLGTGIAPFIWILDQLEKQKYRCLLIYTNSFKDQDYHRQVLSLKVNERYQEIISWTRQGGLKIIRVLEGEAQHIYENIIKFGAQNTRIFYCGPKEVYEYLLIFLQKLLGVTIAELKKSKILIYENW